MRKAHRTGEKSPNFKQTNASFLSQASMAPNAKTLSPPPLHLSSSSSNTRSSSSRRIPGYSHHASPTSSLFAPCVIPGVTGRDFIPASPPIRSHLYSLRPITPARRQAIIKAEQPQYSDASMASVLAEPDVSTYSRRSLKRRRSEDELQPEAQLAPPPPRGPHPPLRPMVAVASPPRSPIRRSPIQLARERERSDSDQAELALLNLRNAMRSEQSSITVAPITTVRPRPRVAPAAPVAPSPAAPSTPALPVVTAVEAATTSTAAVPITVSDTGSASTTTATNSKRNARSHLFDAVVAANMPPNADNTSNTSSSNLNSSDCNIVFRRSITSPDDLERAELVHCFEVLHACGRATQPDAPVSSTRKSIEGFLDAVFKNWTPENWEAEGAKPKLEFTTEAEVVAGKICGMFSLFHSALSQSLKRTNFFFSQLIHPTTQTSSPVSQLQTARPTSSPESHTLTLRTS